MPGEANREGSPPIVTIDSATGRKTVNIGALLSSPGGDAYQAEMRRVPTYRGHGTSGRRIVVRKKK